MLSKTYPIDRRVLRSDLQKFWWIGAIYLLGLLSMPLTILSIRDQIVHAAGTPNYQMLVDKLLRVFQLSVPSVQQVLLVLVPILTGIALFRYLQGSRATDMSHALPLKRSTLYNTHILSGLLFLILPLLFAGLLSWVLIAGAGIPHIGILTSHDGLHHKPRMKMS
jgi:ABC-2 type transport system permease protein